MCRFREGKVGEVFVIMLINNLSRKMRDFFSFLVFGFDSKVQFENANMQKSSLNSAVPAAILNYLFNDIFFPCFRNEPVFFLLCWIIVGLFSLFLKKKVDLLSMTNVFRYCFYSDKLKMFLKGLIRDNSLVMICSFIAYIPNFIFFA